LKLSDVSLRVASRVSCKNVLFQATEELHPNVCLHLGHEAQSPRADEDQLSKFAEAAIEVPEFAVIEVLQQVHCRDKIGHLPINFRKVIREFPDKSFTLEVLNEKLYDPVESIDMLGQLYNVWNSWPVGVVPVLGRCGEGFLLRHCEETKQQKPCLDVEGCGLV